MSRPLLSESGKVHKFYRARPGDRARSDPTTTEQLTYPRAWQQVPGVSDFEVRYGVGTADASRCGYHPRMQRSLSALSDGEFDVLVVGGGASGAAAAREASLRGYRTALI